MKNSLFIFTLFCFFSAHAQKKNTGYIINGKVPGIRSGVVYFTEFVTNGKKDSTEIKNESFQFTGKLENPKPVVLNIKDKDSLGAFLIFAENSKIEVVLNKNGLTKSKISGSAAHKDFQLYEKKIKPQTDRMNELYAWVRSGRRINQKEQDSVDRVWAGLVAERKVAVAEFIKENPNSYVSGQLITQYFLSKADLSVLEAQYNSLAPAIQQSTFGKNIKEKIDIEGKTAIGKYAPEFTQNDTLGNPVSLSSFKGKYVLVDFWASWCGPCRAENPNVVKAFRKYKDKGFTVLGVSLDSPAEKKAWLDAIHKDELTWTHVSDLKGWNNEVAKLYGIRAIPRNFLLDPTGKIIAKNIRGEELQQKLDELF